MASFRPFEDCSAVFVTRSWISHWALRSWVLDVWFLVSAQLSSFTEVIFSPSLTVRTVSWLLKDSAPWTQFCVNQSCCLSAFPSPLCSPALCAVAAPGHLSWSAGNRGKQSKFNSLYRVYWLGSSSWMKLHFWNIYEFHMSLLALVSFPSNNWEPVNFITHI